MKQPHFNLAKKVSTTKRIAGAHQSRRTSRRSIIVSNDAVVEEIVRSPVIDAAPVRSAPPTRHVSVTSFAPKMLIIAVGVLLFTMGYRQITPQSAPLETNAREEQAAPAIMTIEAMSAQDQQQLRSTITHADALATLFNDPTTLLKQKLGSVEVWMTQPPTMIAGRPATFWWTVMNNATFQGMTTIAHPSITIVDTSFRSMGKTFVNVHGPDIGITTHFPQEGHYVAVVTFEADHQELSFLFPLIVQ